MCHETILVGERYVKSVGYSEDFYSLSFHEECHAKALQDFQPEDWEDFEYGSLPRPPHAVAIHIHWERLKVESAEIWGMYIGAGGLDDPLAIVSRRRDVPLWAW